MLLTMYGIHLRLKCLIIGYMHLLASIVNIGCHFLVVSIITNGFQCDIKAESLYIIDLTWLRQLLFVINFVTFYPFPLHLLTYYDYMQYEVAPRCYPGMLHLSQIEIIKFFINIIWLKFVISFVTAVHKKDAKQMHTFFGLLILKLIAQVIYSAYQIYINFTGPASVFPFLGNTCFSIIVLLIINAYIFQVGLELAQKKVEQPPPYIECSINTPLPK